MVFAKSLGSLIDPGHSILSGLGRTPPGPLSRYDSLAYIVTAGYVPDSKDVGFKSGALDTTTIAQYKYDGFPEYPASGCKVMLSS